MPDIESSQASIRPRVATEGLDAGEDDEDAKDGAITTVPH